MYIEAIAFTADLNTGSIQSPAEAAEEAARRSDAAHAAQT